MLCLYKTKSVLAVHDGAIWILNLGDAEPRPDGAPAAWIRRVADLPFEGGLGLPISMVFAKDEKADEGELVAIGPTGEVATAYIENMWEDEFGEWLLV